MCLRCVETADLETCLRNIDALGGYATVLGKARLTILDGALSAFRALSAFHRFSAFLILRSDAV